MTIEKAFEILTTYMKGSDEAEPVDFDKAILLGIQALRQVKTRRGHDPDFLFEKLPGETET